MRIDLHTHSTRSDGTATPTELVHAAVRAGLDVVAITDHDTAAGWDEAASAASDVGIGLVRGMEISTVAERRSVHLLAYLPDPTYPPLAEELTRITTGRTDRLPLMVAGLQAAGIDLTEDDVRLAAGPDAVIGRPHVADALVAKGVVADRDEAFAGLLAPGGAGYQPKYGTPVPEAIGLVRAAGGVTVVAHPWGRSKAVTADLLAELTEVGLTGVEVDHQMHSADQRAELRVLADRLGLVATGSSDFHGTGKVDHDLGCNTTPPEQLERLLAAADAAREASGRDAPRALGVTRAAP